MNRFLKLLYPDDLTCVVCGRDIPFEMGGVCPDCGEHFPPSQRAHVAEYLDGFCASFAYQDNAAIVIQKFKYESAVYLAPWFARQIPIPAQWTFDCIVPVPLYAKRLRQRGYNQAAALGEALSRRLHVPMEANVLVRIRDTGSQTLLSYKERTQNVKGAFRATAVPHARILLVDDVSTTGATLSACAQALKKAGASIVYGACVCSTVSD